MKHFEGFSSGFTELHTELDAGMLLDFAICHRQNEMPSQKSARVFTAQCHLAD
jgi:hypothetical protein